MSGGKPGRDRDVIPGMLVSPSGRTALDKAEERESTACRDSVDSRCLGCSRPIPISRVSADCETVAAEAM